MDTTTLITLLIVGLSSGTAALVVVGVRALLPNPELRTRMQDYLATGQGMAVTARDLELAEPFFQRVIMPILLRFLQLMAWIWPQKRVAALKQRLVNAGRPGDLTVSNFIGIKGWTMLFVGAGIGLAGYFGHYPPSIQAYLLWFLFALISFFLPDIWLSRRIRQRQEEILRALPDTLDMLVVALEAGLSFENAIIEITNKWRHALARELLQVQRDVGIGLPRRQALQDMSDRASVPDVAQFVSAINQASELGVSIVRVLNVQAEEMRIKRRQRAQESANKAPIKMLLPMVFLIFPALFAILLGPAVPSLMQSLGGM